MMPGLDLNPQEYRRLLENLARFYNSQATAHIGYLLSFALAYIAVFSFVKPTEMLVTFASWLLRTDLRLDAFTQGVLTFTLFVLIGWVLFKIRITGLSPQYLLGRTQYYMMLSDIVWNHLGLSSPDVQYFETLKSRALHHEMGIQTAIIRLFEARLHRSLMRRRTGKDPDPSSNWEVILDVKELREWGRIHGYDMVPSHEHRRLPLWILGYDLTDLLLTAYRPRLYEYLNLEDKGSHGYQIGLRFKGFLDC